MERVFSLRDEKSGLLGFYVHCNMVIEVFDLNEAVALLVTDTLPECTLLYYLLIFMSTVIR
jgi:hypothetical protein